MSNNHITDLSPGKNIDFENECYHAVNSDHFWVQWRFRVLTRALQPILDSRAGVELAIEIGGGDGIIREQLESHFGWTVDLCDINHQALELCRPGKGEIYHYDILDKHESMIAKYDVITLFDVVEHIKEPSEFIEAALAHLKPGGIFAINVPAYNLFFSAYDVALGHYRRYTIKSLVSEFDELPVRIEHQQYWGFSMLPLIALRSLLMRGEPRNNDHRKKIVRQGLKPPNELFNTIMKMLMKTETHILSVPMLGTSVMLIGVKTAEK